MQIVTERSCERLLHKTDFTSRAVSRGREFYRSPSFGCAGSSLPGRCFLQLRCAGFTAAAPAGGPRACAEELRLRGARRPRGLACGSSRPRGFCLGRLLWQEDSYAHHHLGSRFFWFSNPCFLLCLLADMPKLWEQFPETSGDSWILILVTDYTHYRSFWFSKFLRDFGSGASPPLVLLTQFCHSLQTLPSSLANHMLKVHLTVFLLYPWSQQSCSGCL